LAAAQAEFGDALGAQNMQTFNEILQRTAKFGEDTA
jgi:hypothetical protein